MKLFVPLILLLALSACSPAGKAALSGAVDKVESAADTRLELNEQAVCSRVTVRAVKRRYWQSRERGERWAKFCGYTPDSGPIAPLLNE